MPNIVEHLLTVGFFEKLPLKISVKTQKIRAKSLNIY
jgi:hypothetical protein